MPLRRSCSAFHGHGFLVQGYVCAPAVQKHKNNGTPRAVRNYATIISHITVLSVIFNYGSRFKAHLLMYKLFHGLDSYGINIIETVQYRTGPT